MYRLLIIIIVIAATATCNRPEAPATKENKDAFFSLIRFFETEARQLEANSTRVDKRIVINGKSEEHTDMRIDFEDEFLLFRNADINRIAWVDKYRIDSTFLSGELVQLDYQSLDKNLDTEVIQIAFHPNGGAVREMTMVRTTQSALATNRQELAYRPGEGYHIRTHQTGIMGAPTTIEIAGTFISQ